MKKQFLFLVGILVIVVTILTACQAATDLPPTHVATVSEPTAPSPTETAIVEAVDPQALLDAAVGKFATASSFEMRTHEITSYNAIIEDGSNRMIYGEFNSIYDIHRSPAFKVRVQTDFRYSPDSDFTSEEYFLAEIDGVAYSIRVNEDGSAVIEETGGQSVEALIGDTYQAILQFGKDAVLISQDDDEVVYKFEPAAWYLLPGAVRFADLGLLLAQPNGAELVKEYAEELYPDVSPTQFVLHVSIAMQEITRVEVFNQDFMMSFWEAYDQALVAAGADPTQLTRYEILPEHGAEIIIDQYDQAPDFDLPE